jgi:pimeloyl-ACP methyl ester carboxylesterase
MYGLDGAVLLLMPVLWLIVAAKPMRWLCIAGLLVNAVFVIEVIGDLGWFLDRGRWWLHLVLTVPPAVAVAVRTLPGRSRRPALPALAAALGAVLNAYFALVPHERLTLGVLAAAVLPAVAVLVAVALLRRRGRPRSRIVRRLISVGVAALVLPALGIAAALTSTVAAADPTGLREARDRAARVPVRIGTVATEGDDLYFEVRGSGPPLLMISGAQGDAGFYTLPAALLSDEFQVITYDRRGHSRSTRHVTDFDVAQQARDALAVLRATGHESAAVFGNSGGAIIALELATRHPEAVTAVIAHEPPLLTAEPDHRSLAFFTAIDRTARILGAGTGMLMFSLSTGIPFSAYGSIPTDFSERTANQDFFVEHEMGTFVHHRLDIEVLRAGGVPVVLAVGATTLATHRYYGRPAQVLADRLDAPLAVYPGHHLSYFDLPITWTGALRATLHATGH